MTQSEMVLRHFREVGPLTGAQAMSDYGIAHLASRISDLRTAGYPISKTMKKSKNRFGNVIYFAEYRLEEVNA